MECPPHYFRQVRTLFGSYVEVSPRGLRSGLSMSVAMIVKRFARKGARRRLHGVSYAVDLDAL